MAKVHGNHDIVPNPGVSGEEFEQFFTQEGMTAPQPSGMRVHLWKGDRGERAGQYAVVIEFDSVETRDRLFSTEDTLGEEVPWAYLARRSEAKNSASKR